MSLSRVGNHLGARYMYRFYSVQDIFKAESQMVWPSH